MEHAWLTRLRWRRRGAWLWPVFAAITAVDAVIGHTLPASGETQTLLAAVLSAVVLNLIAVVLFSGPLGALARRVRPDLPRVVARDYAGTSIVVAVLTALLIAGLVHHPTVVDHRHALQDAIKRAQAFIGYRAPAEFRGNLTLTSTVTIEPESMYRTCVMSARHTRTYCVIVKTQLPFDRSVSFAGFESNEVFAGGAG
jgi:hypothetical protein